METTTLALLVLIPLLVWRIYARLRQLTGRRRSRLWRHWGAALLGPALLGALALAAMPDRLALSCLGAGALAGAWCGWWEMRLTRFENNRQGLFHTPHRHLGLALTMLFVARLIQHGLELYLNSRAALPAPPPEFVRSPLTLLGGGLLAAYFGACGWGLLRWRRGQRALAEPG